jgi:hypothetical protein
MIRAEKDDTEKGMLPWMCWVDESDLGEVYWIEGIGNVCCRLNIVASAEESVDCYNPHLKHRFRMVILEHVN